MTNELTRSEGVKVIAAPHPFKVERLDTFIPQGISLSEILEIIQPDSVLRTYAHIFINDILIPKSEWENRCPNEGDVVTIRVVPMGGGGGGGGKNPLKTILTIGIIAASLAFAGPVGGFLLGPTLAGTAIGATTLGAIVGSVVIGGVGMLISNALIPPRTPTSPGMPLLSGTGGIRSSPTLFIEGARNSEQQFGVIPVVLGIHKHVPPVGAKTFTEIVGNDQHLRMMVVWGYGRLKIEELKIGDTAIAEFDDVEVETVEGVSGDSDLSLFPDSVKESNFSILLEQVDDWTTRTSEIEADELSVDVFFARGLVTFDNNGNRNNRTVVFEIQFRETGTAGAWLDPTFTAQTAPSSAEVVTVTDNKSSAVRHGLRWKVASRGQYDVRVRRTTADSTSTQIFDEITWVTLRSILNEDPDNFAFPLAKTALVVKATNQLSNIIDNLNGKVSSYVLDFTGSSAGWVLGISSNPASLFRHVLQSDASANPLADSRIDLDTLETWHTFCADNNLEFNMIRDFQASIWETLTDICIAGRASPTQIDGKWSVVIDKIQTIPIQHFTPRNSWGFEAEKDFVDVPHALRIRFANRNLQWNQDERIVYDDGFNAASATRFEEIDAIGMTDEDHVWKFGRFNLVQMRLRPEKWFLSTDFEYLVSKRGDLILVTHDVLLVGLKSGRIKAIQTDSAGDVTGITVDEDLIMESGNSYGISIRTEDDVGLTKEVVLDVGTQTTIVFTTVIAADDSPVVEDLFGFGILGSETIEGMILSVESQSNMSARLTLTPYSSAIYTADTGTIPTFDSKLTPQAFLPDVIILNTRTDETVLRLGAGDTIIPRIGISHEPISNEFNATIRAQIRVTSSGQNFAPAVISFQSTNEIIIEDIEQLETYDIRLQWIDPNKLPGAFSFTNNVTVIGQTNPPEPLSNLTISAFGGSALLRWDLPTDLDVRFGGVVKFRHSHEPNSVNASWSASVSIGTSAKGSDLIAQLPLKPGTYLARVFDKGGRTSTVVKIDTKQASVLSFAAATNITEETIFSGIHTNTVTVDGILKLIGAGLVDDIVDVDLVADWDSEGGVVSSGTYDFAAGFDFTTISKRRMTTDINVIISNVLDEIDDRTDLIDDWESFDGDVSGEADARVQIRVTDDDPAASAADFSVWNDIDSAEFNNRGYDFRVQLTSENSAFNPIVSKLQVNSEELA